jgi:hypothetical protein
MDFERSYALSADGGEHEPAAIRTLVLKLVPPAKSVTTLIVRPGGAVLLSFR